MDFWTSKRTSPVWRYPEIGATHTQSDAPKPWVFRGNRPCCSTYQIVIAHSRPHLSKQLWLTKLCLMALARIPHQKRPSCFAWRQVRQFQMLWAANLLLPDARPWFLFKDIVRFGLLPVLIGVIQNYFKEMEHYVDKYIGEANCTVFNERRWLEFRSLFIRIYRQPSVLLSSSHRESTVKVNFPTFKNLAANMSVGKPTGSCYLLESEFDPNLAPEGWVLAKNNPFRRRDIGVGSFNWWGATEMLQALESPEKNVRYLMLNSN